MELTIRSATEADISIGGAVIYEAFQDLADRSGFPSFFPTLEAATEVTVALIPHPAFESAVAEINSEVIGIGFMDKRGSVWGIGPVAVAPNSQSHGVGRKLMQFLLKKGQEAAGIRLTQEAYNVVSLALYATLGFQVKEPAALLTGVPKSKPVSDVEVRPFHLEDLDKCAALCQQVYGCNRERELLESVQFLSPFVAIRSGEIVAYATATTSLGYGVAKTDEDMQALLLGIAPTSSEPISIIVPLRNSVFLEWCLAEGLRVIKPITLMAIGEYVEPQGSYFLSVSY